jgi:hypothetical protein
MDSDWKIQIFTGPFEEDWLVTEIYYKDEEWANITHFGKEVKFYPKRDGSPWIFNSDEMMTVLLNAIQEAKKG